MVLSGYGVRILNSKISFFDEEIQCLCIVVNEAIWAQKGRPKNPDDILEASLIASLLSILTNVGTKP